MTIQFNTDKHLTIHDDYRAGLTTSLTEKLNRFSSQITRLEVHFSSENGEKEGLQDKQCILEARLEGLQPIAVKEISSTYDLAMNGAISKLKASIDHKLGKLKSH